MRVTKWIFFGYLAIAALIVGALAISFAGTPPRDPRTLYRALPDTIRTLDPAEVNDTIGAPLVGAIYECLYNYKFAQTDPYEVVPEVAAEMPLTSEDHKVLTIKLRKGIHFYDPNKVIFPDGVGPEIRAKDVIYSFKRLANYQLASPNYSSIFQDEVVGLDDWWKYTQQTATPDKIDWDRAVEGFQIVDDFTIRIKLVKPDPQMIYKLAHEPTGIVCKAAVDHYGDTFRDHPVGTGPYSLRSNDYVKDQRLTLRANPIYRGRPDVDGSIVVPEPDRMPHVKTIEYDYFAEELPIWILFKQGLLDIGGIPKDTFSQAISIDSGELTPAMERRGIVLKKDPEPWLEYIGFNMTDPVVGRNKPLRQAMSMAFDRETYIRNFLNGRGEPAIGPIPPGFPTYDPHEVNPYTQFNLAAASEKMKEAIRINGGPIPPLTILMRSADTLSRQMAEYFRDQMARIGVELRPEFRDWARWQQMVDQRQTQIFDAGWTADYPDEQTFLSLLYGPNSTNGGVNSTVYDNPEYNALYERASVLPDSPERRDLYRKMERIAMDDCPWLLETSYVYYWLRYDWVGNFHPMDYGYGFQQELTLDSPLRKRRQMGGH